MDRDRSLEIRAILLFALAIILFLSLSSYSPDDLAFFSSNPNNPYRNQVRAVGAYLGMFLFFLFGRAAYLVPFALAFWAIVLFTVESSTRFLIKFLGGLLLFLSSASFLATVIEPVNVSRMDWGGFLGLVLSDVALHYLGKPGALVLFSTFILLALLLTTEFLIMPFLWRMWVVLVRREKRVPRPILAQPPIRSVANAAGAAALEASRRALKEMAPEIVAERKPQRIITTEPIPARRQEALPPRRKVSPADSTGYKLPGLELLDSPPPVSEREIREDLEENSRILEGTLADFGIEAHVVQVDRGPVITRYELSPAPGVKLTRITSLSDDIALAMKAPSVRIVAPIPGKAAVGIEVPNSKSTLVYMKELIESKEYQALAQETKLVLALGKDVSGVPIVANLTEMPHLLIAGATGSGKTVCVNALITSLVYNAAPDELKFLMIDPKMVELAPFNGIPHLLCPVVTEHKKAAGALSWVVEEMERRYKEFAEAGVRNITMFNEKFPDKKLFYIILIIDELADLMLIAQADVENTITRLSQLSRAVGIHIIIATQRPSVDVITGVIKANFPARISFKVASKVDSRTVLDSNGADKLLGKGDMLFLKPGTGKLVRAQGTLIRDNEIERVVDFVKKQREPQYNEEILAAQQERTGAFGNLGEDEYYDEAVRMVMETGQASTSMLQRRLRLGYTRAARLIDMMEERGIVGPYRGARPREILVTAQPSAHPKSADEGSNAA